MKKLLLTAALLASTAIPAAATLQIAFTDGTNVVTCADGQAVISLGRRTTSSSSTRRSGRSTSSAPSPPRPALSVTIIFSFRPA